MIGRIEFQTIEDFMKFPIFGGAVCAAMLLTGAVAMGGEVEPVQVVLKDVACPDADALPIKADLSADISPQRRTQAVRRGCVPIDRGDRVLRLYQVDRFVKLDIAGNFYWTHAASVAWKGENCTAATCAGYDPSIWRAKPR